MRSIDSRSNPVPFTLARHMGVALCVMVLGLGLSSRAADTWIDVSSRLLAELTNNGVKLPWPGGCSGVIVDRQTGDVTIKVVGSGLFLSKNRGEDWTRI